jgi:hypothetical protein
MSQFEQIWASYRHDNGFTPPPEATPDDEAYIIALDSGQYVFVEEEPISETVLVKAVLAFLPLDNDDEINVYRQLLEAHLLGEATGGACFAIDPDADELIAYRRLPIASLDASQLAKEISDLATTAMRFAELLKLPAPAASLPSS